MLYTQIVVIACENDEWNKYTDSVNRVFNVKPGDACGNHWSF